MIRFGCIFLLALLCFPQPALSKVKVLDGDSLVINGIKIRLKGIDAPEYNQKCWDRDNKMYSCGIIAKKRLEQLISSDIHCNKIDVDRYKRQLSVCYQGQKDINETMVLEGMAVAYLSYSNEYESAHNSAKKNKIGIWKGRFMKPELFRRLNEYY